MTFPKRASKVKRVILVILLTLLCWFWIVRPLWYEAWCCATGAEDTWLEVYSEHYADGVTSSPFAIACDGMCAGMDMYVCYPLSPKEMLVMAEEAYGADLTITHVAERSRWRTICVVENEDGSLRVTLTSVILRWYSDNGNWMGFQRSTYDNCENRVSETYAPMLGY